MKDYYQILGILETASQKDIRQAYLRLALLWHPDRHVGADPKEIEAAETWFKEIGEAYGVLSDPRQRSDYDYFRSKRARNEASATYRPASSSSGSTAGTASGGAGAGRAQKDSSYARGHNWGSSYGASSHAPSGHAARNRKSWKDRLWNAAYAAFVASVVFSWWQDPITHIFNSTVEAVGRVSSYTPREWGKEQPKTFQDMLMDDLSFPTLKMKKVEMPDSTWFALHKYRMK